MGHDRRVMCDGFGKTGAHSNEWLQITIDFMNQAFAGGTRVVKSPCRIYQNFAFLLKDDIKWNLCKNGFMLNYLVWREHRGVEAAAESNENEDEDQMDEMIVYMGREYDLYSEE
jgi:hypothetical protein